MTDETTSEPKPKVSKIKIYSTAFGIFIISNFVLETGITLIENKTQQWLDPIFPFTRLGLLIATIMIANAYIRRRERRPKQILWWRILRPILLILVTYGLIMAAWLSVAQADLERSQLETEKMRESLLAIQLPLETGSVN